MNISPENISLRFLAVNDYIEIVTMWLSTEETTMLDNALITMEHLYKSGIIKISLRRLMNEQSFFEIDYSIGKKTIEVTNEDDENEVEQEQGTLKFTLSAADIDDHKRQLTFCNVDLQQEMAHKQLLLKEQLKLLAILEKIYSILLKLEMVGHPHFQLRENQYEIFDRYGKTFLSRINSMIFCSFRSIE